MLKKTDPQIITSYLEDSSGLKGGRAEVIYIPENTREVADILVQASQKKEPITLSGGGTGVTGGRIPFGGSIISLERFNQISKIKDKNEGEELRKITVGAGVLIADIHKVADENGLFYPPDATEYNASIGGNIATNASGARSFKYGSTRRYVERLEVVLISGEILDIPRGKYRADKAGIINFGEYKLKIPQYHWPQIKNAAGYFTAPGMDLIDLFIGSEGTLGVVTQAELKLLPKPGPLFFCFAFFASLEAAIDLVKAVRERTFTSRAKQDKAGLDALGIEYFDAHSLDLLRPKYPHIPAAAQAMIFVEEEITSARQVYYLEDWAALLEKHNVLETWLADDHKKQKEFKDFRHALPEAVNEIVRRRGFPKTGTDMAVPDAGFPAMFATYYQALKMSGMQYLVFGHIGENHLHVNILPRSEAEVKKAREIYVQLVRRAVALGGTPSAEHGIGKLKHIYLKEMVGEEGIKEMVRIKKALEPACILGRGNMFAESYLSI